MLLSQYLRQKKEGLDLSSTEKLFNHYGGQEKLNISFRQFQNIENGTSPPTVEFLARLFALEPIQSRQGLIQSFFESHLNGTTLGEPLLKYLSNHLSQALEEGKFDWNKTNNRPYNELQLSFLLSRPDALRFHRRMLLSEVVKKRECSLDESTLTKLEKLDLISIKNDRITSPHVRYKLPKFKETNPKMMGLVNDLIFKQIDLFLSREGSDSQEIGYAFQLVPRSVAVQAKEQLRLLKEWIQSHMSLKPLDKAEDEVPIVFVGFVKALDSHELR